MRYGSNVDLITYFVEDPTAIAYISKNWQEGDTVNIAGRLRFTTATNENHVDESEIGFGEVLPTTYSRRVRELIITGGSPGALDDEQSYDTDEIAKALAARKARLAAEAVKSETKSPANLSPATKPKAKFDGGF